MGFLGFLKQKKIRRLARDWQFNTKTGFKDFEFKTKSPYGEETLDDEAYKLWLHTMSYLRTHGRERGKESFTCATSKKLSLYLYHFDDGRTDNNGRWISSFLMVFVTPDETKRYTFKDFINEIYSKKASLGKDFPTAFDFADKFPIIWNDNTEMESNDKAFLQAHKKARGGDFAFERKDFQKGNSLWRESQMENATMFSTQMNDSKELS